MVFSVQPAFRSRGGGDNGSLQFSVFSFRCGRGAHFWIGGNFVFYHFPRDVFDYRDSGFAFFNIGTPVGDQRRLDSEGVEVGDGIAGCFPEFITYDGEFFAVVGGKRLGIERIRQSVPGAPGQYCPYDVCRQSEIIAAMPSIITGRRRT